MASLGPRVVDIRRRSVVMLKTTGIEEEIALCSLRFKIRECIDLDLHFEGEERLNFSLVVGWNDVYLTGNFIIQEDHVSSDKDKEYTTIRKPKKKT